MAPGRPTPAPPYFDEHMMSADRCVNGVHPHRGIIIGPTFGDVVESCIEGPSGLKAHNPTVEVQSRGGRTFAVWPNRARARLVGANSAKDIERLRAAGNTCLAWYEEFAAWPYMLGAHNQALLGRRLGPKPRTTSRRRRSGGLSFGRS